MTPDNNGYREPIRQLHDHLAAVQERPVDRMANRWIGEAESVVADIVGEDLEHHVFQKRLSHVEELLDHVEELDDSAASDHLAEAKRSTADLLDRLEDD
ncbi:MAG: hypothetical protein ACI9EZ_000788 [Halobacteriales archaeon]|jgi:hypothetical protein